MPKYPKGVIGVVCILFLNDKIFGHISEITNCRNCVNKERNVKKFNIPEFMVAPIAIFFYSNIFKKVSKNPLHYKYSSSFNF